MMIVVEFNKTAANWLLEFYRLWDKVDDNEDRQPNMLYLSRQRQSQLPLMSAQKLDDISRRNVGILLAIACGAEYIYEPNANMTNAHDTLPIMHLEAGPYFQAKGNNETRLVNPYALYGRPDIWPKGFPIQAVKAAAFEYRKVQAPRGGGEHRPLVQWSLVDGHPQMSALSLSAEARSGPKRFFKQPRAGIAIQPGYFAPVGRGGVIFKKEAFWGMPLLRARRKALAHVWRSLWVQRLLWSIQGQLLIAPATGEASRANAARELSMLAQELDGHADTTALIEFLHR